MFHVLREKLDNEKTNDELTEDMQHRLPPGQYVTDKFPVLHYGDVPTYEDIDNTWDLRIWGEIEQPTQFSLAEFRTLPTIEVITDIHCVTRWSKLNTRWEGVQFKELLRHIPQLKPDAHFVLFHCEQGFTSNLPLSLLLKQDILLARKYNGIDLTPDHGYPLRLLVPGKYFWKSAKWLRGIEFLSQDTLGFWERYGYHNHADPWSEERYAE